MLRVRSARRSRIVSERAREDLDGHVAPEPRVARTIDFAHSTGTNESLDLEHAYAASRERGVHRRRRAGRGIAGSSRNPAEAAAVEQHSCAAAATQF